MRPRFTGLWRQPDFMRLWAGQTVSVFGSLVGWTALQFTAILWLHATPFQVSVLAACQLLPAFLAGLAAGVWVDRLHRRPLMIAADAGRALALASVPVAALLDALTMPQLYVVAAIAAVLGVLFEVAYESFLPSLVGRDRVIEGNSKLTASASVAEVTAFSAAGWLVQWLTAPVAVLIDALSFLWSAWWVARIRTPEPSPAPPAETASFRREVTEGLRFLVREPLLRTLALTDVLLQFGNRMVGTVILFYLAREVGFEPGALGLIFAVGGMTSLVGAWLAGRAGRLGGIGPSLALALLLVALGTAAIPLTAEVSAFGVALLTLNQLVADPASTYYNINELSLRQSVTPDGLQGRIHAGVRVLNAGGMLLGTLGAGLLAGVAGARTALWVAVGVTLVAALWLWRSPVGRLRSLRVAEPDATLVRPASTEARRRCLVCHRG